MSKPLKSVLELPIAALHLSVRSSNALAHFDPARWGSEDSTQTVCKTLGDLTNTTPDQLMAQRNFGMSSLKEVEAALDRYELKLLRYPRGSCKGVLYYEKPNKGLVEPDKRETT